MNRSAPPGEVVPGLYYDDVEAAIEWLCGAFSFTERYRYGPPGHTVGAFLAVGDSTVALSETRSGQSPEWDDDVQLRPPPSPLRTGGISVRVRDVDAHYAQVEAFGAKTFGPPATYRFGERQYTAEDLAGHRWSFTQSVADIDPRKWGAILPQ